ncbi:MAG TPA: MarR family transcriptional regulator [Micrococcaceae bacterium]|nr:MarR family transcriptional regulator [Micrococcaceae bacterium]
MSGSARKEPTDHGVAADHVESVMRAARVLLSVVAQSVAEVEDIVTSPQLRVLVLISSRGPQNPGAIAADLDVHPSNATRTCERLVNAGLIERSEDPRDRRYLQLTLSPRGEELVTQVMDHRRAAIAKVVRRLPAATRKNLAEALNAFAEAAGDSGTDDGRFALPSED